MRQQPPQDSEIERLQREDKRQLHPWSDLRALDDGNRTVLDRGSGVYVHDHDGNRLLDGPGGMWCVNAGHGCEAIIDAITEQLRRLSYASPWELANAPAAELAARLAELSPGDLNRVMFTTGGSTAVDTALRFVGFYNNFLGRPDKKHVISRESAYHGSTYLAASVSGKERDRSWFDFATDFVHHLPLPGDRGVEELEAKILEIGADRLGAFITEPVMGAAGVIVPPHGYLAGCREVCTRHDVIYISDEVVTAFGRLGHWFASEGRIRLRPRHHHHRQGHHVRLPATGRRADLRAITCRIRRQHRCRACDLRQRLHLFWTSGCLRRRAGQPELHGEQRPPGARP